MSGNQEGKISFGRVLNSAGKALLLLLLALTMLQPLSAQSSPWESSALRLQQAFTGPIARALSLVAIVVGGLTMAFSETGGKRVIAGIIFGVGMAVGAVSFLSWLFGV